MNSEAASPIMRLDGVCIVFGEDRNEVLRLADANMTRGEIQKQTGAVLGVHNCSVDVDEGEILVLMGLSGSGKSTLLRAINRLNPITRGQILIAGEKQVHDVGAAKRAELMHIRKHFVAMVFQQFGLLPWRTVADNVGFGLELSGVKKKERATRVEEQLELVGLSEWANRKVGDLSGGMQQRVGLARAFATGAPILLMDEPFSALDPLIRARLQDELLDLQARLKKTIVFVSHDLDEAMKIGNRIAIMEGGRIIQCGTAQEILINPADAYVADFVQHMNPLGVLTAEDVMATGDLANLRQKPVATAKASTPVNDLIRVLGKAGGTVAIVDQGRITGTVSADDIVAAMAFFQNRQMAAKQEAPAYAD